MLKQAVKYKDFDDKEQVAILYFNLTKAELIDNLDLQDEFARLEQDFKGEFTRELDAKEIRRVIELVKRIMKMAYGIRSEDGKRFVKNDEIWTEFVESAVYSEFLYNLFVNPNAAVAWLTELLPEDLRKAALEAANHTGNGMSAERTAEVIAAQKAQSERAEAAAAEASGNAFQERVANSPEGTPLKENIVGHLQDLSKQEANGKPQLSDPPTESEAAALMEWIKNN